MIIRPETPAEYDKIYELIETAFESAEVSDGDEQEFAANLRKDPIYIPELALVLEDKGEVIGHIMLTHKAVTDDEENTVYQGLLLAPLCVRLESRNQGLGARLVEEALNRAKEMGFGAVFLAGDPYYYSRFGFSPTIGFNIKNIHGIEDQYIMTKEIISGALNGVSGWLDLY